jgi:outer membrane protein OmpA-like peptidoglycan-associated protein
MRLFVSLRRRDRAFSPAPGRAALALCALLAFAAPALAQSAPGVSVNWGALAQAAAPSTGVAIDWSALDALGTKPAAAPGAVTLHPPPKPPATAAVTPPKPPAKPVAAAPKAPVAPAIAGFAPRAVSPPPPPAAPAIASLAPRAVAVPPPPPAKTAVVPAAAPALVPGKTAMLRFAKGQSDIPADGRDMLNAVAAQLAANTRQRLQLVAYASAGSNGDTVEARRIALARAVQLRTYLIDKGVQSVRMDVRALGNSSVSDGPADRVDFVIVER